MLLTPITEQIELEIAHKRLVEVLTSDATSFIRRIGWRGGSADLAVYWHPQHQFWVAFDERNQHHYSVVCGTGDPQDTRAPQMTCQMNHKKTQVHHPCSAVFLKGEESKAYFARNLRVRGIDLIRLRTHFSGELTEVKWPDRGTSELIVFGSIGGAALPINMSSFLRAVDWLKTHESHEEPVPQQAMWFTPEFAGSRSTYVLEGTVESECFHGAVVNTLHDILKSIGRESYRTKAIDLYMTDAAGNVTHLIEVKTDQSTTSIYKAIGQVMWHGAVAGTELSRIVALPGEASVETVNRLERLGISILRYEWRGGRPTFRNLELLVSRG